MPAMPQNPLLPGGYDLMWTVVVAAVVALAVTALWQVLRSKALTGLEAVVWVLAILALPVLGSLAWLAIGRSKRPADATG